MSDEVNVWRDACFAYGGASIEGAELEPSAAAVIRDYGDERYQAAIADVVEWFAENAEKCSLEAAYSGKPYCPPQWTAQDAIDQITRRFGKDA